MFDHRQLSCHIFNLRPDQITKSVSFVDGISILFSDLANKLSIRIKEIWALNSTYVQSTYVLSFVDLTDKICKIKKIWKLRYCNFDIFCKTSSKCTTNFFQENIYFKIFDITVAIRSVRVSKLELFTKSKRQIFKTVLDGFIEIYEKSSLHQKIRKFLH